MGGKDERKTEGKGAKRKTEQVATTTVS